MSSYTELADVTGKRIQLGKKLGAGGEGAVYEVPTLGSNIVAKIYHALPKPAKQEKLKAMVQARTDDLLAIATWPLGAIHDTRNGAVAGFLMPRMSGYQEIHKLYGPAHRKQEFPDADWKFLVQVARNTAAAIATCHRLGHVIGDINPNNVVVSQQATVKLIDCDSFQIKHRNGLFLCEVGVPHFTPPELFGKKFDVVQRTANHDCFGLALLCFHLLFMGRHPYAGRYRGGTQDMPIDRAIPEFRFAYSSSAASKQMSPPPNALTLSMVPSDMRRMFELAFGQDGPYNKRPTAHQWISALDKMAQSLSRCRIQNAHIYSTALGTCPWCTLEAQSGVVYFLSVLRTIAAPAFDLNQVWNTISGIVPPNSVILPTFAFTGQPSMFVLPNQDLTISEQIDAYRTERSKRATIRSAAKKQWEVVQEDWKRHAADKRFEAKLKELRALRDKHNVLSQRYDSDRKQVVAQARGLQADEFLKRHFIDKAKISGIGPVLVATLASYGIETAYDISGHHITAIPGFGPTRTADLVQWRASVERRFVFDPSKVSQLPALVKLEREHTLRVSVLENGLKGGLEELKKIRHEITTRSASLMPILEKHHLALAQAQADLAHVESRIAELNRRKLTNWFQTVVAKPFVRYAVAMILTVAVLGAFGPSAMGFVAGLLPSPSVPIQGQSLWGYVHETPTPTGAQASTRSVDPTDKHSAIAGLPVPVTQPGSVLPGPFVNPHTTATSTAKVQRSAVPINTPALTTPNPSNGTGAKRIVGRVEVLPYLQARITLNSWLYYGPDTDRRVGVLHKGDRVELLGRLSSKLWCKIRSKAVGEQGWIYCVFLDIDGELDSVPLASS